MTCMKTQKRKKRKAKLNGQKQKSHPHRQRGGKNKIIIQYRVLNQTTTEFSVWKEHNAAPRVSLQMSHPNAPH